jgi:hypothetical protein
MSDAKLYMYTRKGTACEQVVGNNDKVSSYKQSPNPQSKSSPAASKSHVYNEMQCVHSFEQVAKTLEGVEPTIVWLARSSS